MRRMGDVLAGIHAAWEFESDALVIRFERGIRTPKLFQVLRERRVPYEALASVALAPGKRGTVVLHAVPRPGADPLMEAAAGQLKEGSDPYRLVLPADRETLAEYYRDELRALLPPEPGAAGAAGHGGSDPYDVLDGPSPGGGPAPDNGLDGLDGPEEPYGTGGAVAPAERFLVAPPPGPLSFKAYDGKASFDGSAEVAFRWFWTGASSEKWKAGDQTFSVRDLCGVEWRSPDVFDGHLRLVLRDGGPRPTSPTTTRRPSSSASATGSSTSPCPSPRPSSRRSAPRTAPRARRLPDPRSGGRKDSAPGRAAPGGAGDGRGVLREEGGVARGALRPPGF